MLLLFLEQSIHAQTDVETEPNSVLVPIVIAMGLDWFLGNTHAAQRCSHQGLLSYFQS